MRSVSRGGANTSVKIRSSDKD